MRERDKPLAPVTAVEPSKPVVLVVDDDPDGREAFLGLLDWQGYSGVGVASGNEAFAYLAESGVPALIVVDLTLPEMSGSEFVSRLKESSRFAEIPILVHSAAPQAREAAIAMGASAGVRKSADLDELLAALRRYCAPRA